VAEEKEEIKFFNQGGKERGKKIFQV